MYVCVHTYISVFRAEEEREELRSECERLLGEGYTMMYVDVDIYIYIYRVNPVYVVPLVSLSYTVWVV